METIKIADWVEKHQNQGYRLNDLINALSRIVKTLPHDLLKAPEDTSILCTDADAAIMYLNMGRVAYTSVAATRVGHEYVLTDNSAKIIHTGDDLEEMYTWAIQLINRNPSISKLHLYRHGKLIDLI